MKALHIVGWHRYEHPDVRRYDSRMPWVKTMTHHDGLGFIELLTHEHGEAHFGVWNLLLQLAANGSPRGFLVTNAGRTMGSREVAMKTHSREPVVAEAIKRLLAIGWIERIHVPSASERQADGKLMAREQLVEREKEKEKEREGMATAPRPPVDEQVKNSKALQVLLRGMGELSSGAVAVREWATLMQAPGIGQCANADEVLEGVAYLVKACRREGIKVKYSKDVPAQIVIRWANTLKARDMMPAQDVAS